MKKIVLNFVLLGASLALALSLGEIVGRMYLSYQDRMLREKRKENILTQVPKHELFAPANPGSFANRPNAVVHWWGFDIHIDSLGCRQGITAPDSARTILFIGDSMIFGLGLPDSLTIPALLQKVMTNLDSTRNVRVVNAAVIGYDFQQYLYQIDRLVPKIKPDLVLVGLCYNDLLPNEDPFNNVLNERGLQAKVIGENDSRPEKKLSTLSKLKNSYRNLALYKLWKQSNLGNRNKHQAAAYSEPAVAASHQKAPQLVEEFLKTVARLKVRSAFVYFPIPEKLGQPADLPYLKLLKEKKEAVFDLSDTRYLTISDYFLREKEGRMQPDIHYNLSGSRVVAEEIGEWLIGDEVWK